ncbi:MAG: Maf family protein, partial [Chloroflexota bacterium]|nr:Maf family protein [Chloroflexota bacterium]
MPLVLASASPRRRALLAHLGLPFRVVVPEVDEDTPPSSRGRPEALAETLALAKAESVARHATDALIIAADTMVVDGDTILGKPRDATHAQAMLRRLRAREHRVITGLAVVDAARLSFEGSRPPPEGGGIEAAAFRLRWGKDSEMRTSLALHVITLIRMRAYADAEIAAYVARGEPLDKAGAYAIQDEAFH